MDLGSYIEAKLEQALGNTVVPALNRLTQAENNEPSGSGGGGTSESAMAQAAQAGADRLITDMNPTTGGVLGFLSNLPLVGGVFSVFADPLRDLFGKAGDFVSGLALGWGLGSVAGEVMSPLSASLVYSAHRAAGDGRIDPATAARLWAKGILTQSQAQHEALDQGFANDPDPGTFFPNLGRIQQLMEGELVHPNYDQLIELLRRGLIQPADYLAFMGRNAYEQGATNLLLGLKRNLLSPADLALGHLRGDVSDQLLASYGPMVGVDPEDMAILIANTGEPPGLEELMSMWRRGFIDQARFERGVRQSRVRDEWISYLEQARFQPMTIADAARAVVENYLSDSEGQAIAEQNGLEAAHWPIIRESWGRPLSRTEMSELYHRGQASRAEFDQAMRESDVKDKYVGKAFELGRVLIPQRQIVSALQHGVISHPEAVRMLMQEGYDQTDAEVLVSLGAAEHHAQLKELTKADIQTLYADRLITRQQAIEKLTFLGYAKDVSEWVLSLAQAHRTAQLARTLQSQVRALYLKRELTRDEAIDKLVKAGTDQQDAHALVDEWELVHSVPSRQLTEAQLVKAAKDGVIEVAEAAHRLVSIGYTEHDATILLQIAGLVSYEVTIGPNWTPPAPGALFGGP